MFVHICLHLDKDVICWESNNPSDFVTRSFLWILGYNTSL